jgi:hypothetical protein
MAGGISVHEETYRTNFSFKTQQIISSQQGDSMKWMAEKLRNVNMHSLLIYFASRGAARHHADVIPYISL